jgi:segregation and condensation protein B
MKSPTGPSEDNEQRLQLFNADQLSEDPNRSGQQELDDEQELDEEQGLSLEELSQTYAQLLNKGEAPNEADESEADAGESATGDDEFDPLAEELVESDTCPVTPLSIVEAVLFVGRPDNSPIGADELAGLMRGVRVEEIEDLVAQLNQTYEATGRAMRIEAVGNGYRVQLADDLQVVRDRFYGPVREVRLNQAAIDCLALIAYQPGISRDKLEEQRGQPSGSVLNQLVRRQLIEMKREGEKQNRQVCYYPTDKLTQLIGLSALEDLPQVEEWQ